MNTTDRRRFLKNSAWLGLSVSVGAASPEIAAAEKARGPNRLRIVTLQGTSSERGIQHGKTLKDPIHALVKAWKADLVRRYQMDAALFISKFLKHTDYLPAMRKWTPGLLEEVRGIAQGAGIDFETMIVFQLIDEYWVHGPGVAGEHCSALGLSRRGDQPSLVAQNMDLEGFRDGFQTILHIKPDSSSPESLVLTHAGLIGLNGMSNRSIGICCNTLSQLMPCRDGLPVACVVRGVLEQQTEKAALEFLHRVKHASGQNYIVGGPDQVLDLECSARKVTAYKPPIWPEVVLHTNHPLANDDFTPKYRQLLANKKDQATGPENSQIRLRSLERYLMREADLDRVKKTLSAKDSAEHPVCRPYTNNKDGYTFASVIMVLSGQPELLVAPGPPDVHSYQTCRFGG